MGDLTKVDISPLWQPGEAEGAPTPAVVRGNLSTRATKSQLIARMPGQAPAPRRNGPRSVGDRGPLPGPSQPVPWPLPPVATRRIVEPCDALRPERLPGLCFDARSGDLP